MTHTHTTTEFADPYKVCNQCGGWVDGVLNTPGPQTVIPCEHQRGYRDLCPSWGPADGCQCVEHLGERSHPLRDDVPEGKVP